MIKQLLIVILSLLMWGSISHAQNIIPQARLQTVDDSNYPQVSAYFTVQNPADLTPIRDLSAEDVTVSLGDTPLTITSLDLQRRPLHVVAVVDVTGSVSELEYANQGIALLALAEQLQAEDELGIVLFDADSVTVAAPLQTTHQNALAALENRTVDPETEGNVFWDGIAQAVELLADNPPDVRRAIVILTDTIDQTGGGVQPDTAVIQQAIQHGIEVFGLYFVNEGAESADQLPTELNVISEATGGAVFWDSERADPSAEDSPDDTRLPNTMASVLSLLLSEYHLVVEVPADSPPNTLLNIGITYQGNRIPAMVAPIQTEPIDNPQQAATPDPVSTGLRVTLDALPDTLDPEQTVVISAKIDFAASVQRVELRINDETITTQTLGPFDDVRFEWQPDETGSATIAILAESITGESSTASTTVTIQSASGGGVNPLLIVVGGILVAGLTVVFGGVFLMWRRQNRPMIFDVSPPVPNPDYAPPSAPPSQEAGEALYPSDDPDPPPDTTPQTPVIATQEPPAETYQTDAAQPVAVDMPPPVVASEMPPPPMPRQNTEPMPPRTPAPQSAYQLRATTGEIWQLIDGENTIGRHHSNLIQLHDETASRHHAKITVSQRKCTFEDWQASHPSEINGALLEANKTYPLRVGDRLRVGSTLLIVEQTSPS